MLFSYSTYCNIYLSFFSYVWYKIANSRSVIFRGDFHNFLSTSLYLFLVSNAVKNQSKLVLSSKANLEWERREKMKMERQMEELTQANDLVRQQMESELRHVTQQLAESKSQQEEVQRKLTDKDRTINSLQRLRTGQTLCGRRG